MELHETGKVVEANKSCQDKALAATEEIWRTRDVRLKEL